MAKSQVKVNRRRFRLETVVGRGQQEVTVPASIEIPENTQYLLQPVLVLGRDKLIAVAGQGKARVTGQLQGFVPCVDDQEKTHIVPIPAFEFVASFAMPGVVPGTRLNASARLESVEVDRDESDSANITAFVGVEVIALETAERELVNGLRGDGLTPEVDKIRLQPLLEVVEGEKVFKTQLDLIQPGVKILAGEFHLGSLHWQILDGRVQVEGMALLRVFSLGQQGNLLTVEGRREFSLTLDFDNPAVTEARICSQVKNLELSMDDGGQGIEAAILIKVRAQGYQEQVTELVAGVAGADYLSEDFCIRNRVGESEFKLGLEGNCQLTEGARVTQIVSRARLLETNAMDDKVFVRGMLTLNVWYAEAEEDLPRVTVVEEEFSQFIGLRGCESGFAVQASCWPEAAHIEAGHYSAPVTVRVVVSEIRDVTVMSDLHVVDPGAMENTASLVVYLAKKGDTLFTVAKNFNVTRELLENYNELAGQEKLAPGQKILVPLYLVRAKRA